MDDAMLAASGLSSGITAKAMLDVEDEYQPNDEDEGQPDEGGLSWYLIRLNLNINERGALWEVKAVRGRKQVRKG